MDGQDVQDESGPARAGRGGKGNMDGQDGQDASGPTRVRGARGCCCFPRPFPRPSPRDFHGGPSVVVFHARGVIQIGLVQAMLPSSMTTRR
jgi:hypothetical protein